jgi:hypothetical protein
MDVVRCFDQSNYICVAKSLRIFGQFSDCQFLWSMEWVKGYVFKLLNRNEKLKEKRVTLN